MAGTEVASFSQTNIHTIPTGTTSDGYGSIVENHLKSISFGYVPLDFLPLLIRKNGEYCISVDDSNSLRLSVFSDQSTQSIVNFKITESQNSYSIPSFPHIQTSDIRSLIVGLKNANISFVNSSTASSACLRTLISPLSITSSDRVFSDAVIHNKKFIKTKKDVKFFAATCHQPHLSVRVITKELSDSANYQTVENMFQEFRVAIVSKSKNLPVAGPFAIMFHPQPALVYECPQGQGQFLDKFMVSNAFKTMTYRQKLKLCLQMIAAQCELHDSNFLLCGTKVDDFVVSIDHKKWETNVKMAASGKLKSGSSRPYNILHGDLREKAPEVSFTRQFTRATEVFHTWKVIKQILDKEKKVLCLSSLLLLHSTELSCENSDPRERPTMNGLYLMLREVVLTDFEGDPEEQCDVTQDSDY